MFIEVGNDKYYAVYQIEINRVPNDEDLERIKKLYNAYSVLIKGNVYIFCQKCIDAEFEDIPSDSASDILEPENTEKETV